MHVQTHELEEATAQPMSESPAKLEDEKTKELRIDSRFGAITVDLENAVYFPQGLLGLKNDIHFAITDFPQGMGQFKLLQCLNDHAMSFIVLPLNIDNKLIARKDMEDAARVLNIELKHLVCLLIVSVKRTPEGSDITANVRAPVLIDTNDKAGIQYVFPHNKYDIRTPLGSI